MTSSLPWKDKIVSEENVKRVRFNPNFDQIPRPQYNDSTDEGEVKYVGPALTRSVSSLKKRKFTCRNPLGAEGQLSMSGGEAAFVCPERSKYNWSCRLADVINFECLPDDDPLYVRLRFTLKDKSNITFTKILKSLNAHQSLLNDAENLGFVIVLDQFLTDHNSGEIAAMHLVDVFETETSNKKSRPPLLGHLVSKGVRRFVNNKFNLDLTYITKRLIVMAFPAEGIKTMAFNPLSRVRHFLENRHPHSFMLYNLNSDPKYKYDPTKFEGRVRNFGFEEHSPPPLSLLIQICHDISSFLRQSPSHVVAIHCRAGKGRSGTVAASWLLHAGLCQHADDAVKAFARERMIRDGDAGIQLPSQIRYVRYMEHIERHTYPEAHNLTLTHVMTTAVQGKKSLSLKFKCKHAHFSAEVGLGALSPVTTDVSLEEDVRVDAYLDGAHVFVTFFNSRMIDSTPLTLPRSELDGARDLKSFQMLPDSFEISFHFISARLGPVSGLVVLATRSAASLAATPTITIGSQQDKNDNNNGNNNTNNNNTPASSDDNRDVATDSGAAASRSAAALAAAAAADEPTGPLTTSATLLEHGLSRETGSTPPSPTPPTLSQMGASASLNDLEAPVGYTGGGVPSIERKSLRDIDPSRKEPQKIQRKPTGYIKRNPSAEKEDLLLEKAENKEKLRSRNSNSHISHSSADLSGVSNSNTGSSVHGADKVQERDSAGSMVSHVVAAANVVGHPDGEGGAQSAEVAGRVSGEGTAQ